MIVCTGSFFFFSFFAINFGFVGLYIIVALIPLAEFSEPTIMKKYGAKPDPETLDIVNTVARQKQVQIIIFFKLRNEIDSSVLVKLNL